MRQFEDKPVGIKLSRKYIELKYIYSGYLISITKGKET